MGAIKTNHLLLATLAFNVIYWGGGPFVHEPYLPVSVSIALMVAGFGLMLFYTRGMIDVVFRRKRLTTDPGSYLGVYAGWLAGFAAVVGAMFNLAWVRAGSPPEWTGTTFSNYSRAITAASYTLLLFAPFVGQPADKLPKASTVVVGCVIAVILAFLVGTQIKTTEPAASMAWYGIDRPACAPWRSVWGVSSSKVYHTEDSRYRSLVIPDRCFQNEWEARAAGFRPPQD